MRWFIKSDRFNPNPEFCFSKGGGSSLILLCTTLVIAVHLFCQLIWDNGPQGSEDTRAVRLQDGQPEFVGYTEEKTDFEASGIFNFDDRSFEVGEQIYKNQCADCHGVKGGGSQYYDSQLIGDLAIDELTAYIADTMPEDDPDAVVGEDAKQVAQYIFDAFYSPAAQERINPPRQLFSRLTARQFKESVTDILRLPNQGDWLPEERGLAGRYFASRHWNEKRELSDQTDPQLDFAENLPHFDPTREYPQLPQRERKNREANLMSDGYSVYWHGSILAPRTGWYNIKVETLNGFQLHLNRQDEPLIDYGVRSGDKAVHEARIYLLAGRSYPLKIYLVAYTETETSFRLLWTPPSGIEEVIPERYLIPHQVAPSLALSTPFPADDSSTGYARGISISREWDEAVTAAAIEAADWVVQNLWTLAETSATAEDSLDKIKSYCRRVVETAFAKPLNDEELQFFIEQHFNNDLPLKDQVSRVVILALKSPRFVYPQVETRTADFEIARRLALVLWDSAPDPELIQLATKGKLTDPETCQAQIYRMAYSAKGRAKLLSTFSEWLALDQFSDHGKDLDRFPGFDANLKNDLRRSLDIFLESVLLAEASDYRELFTANYLFATPRMVDFYELELPGNVQQNEQEEIKQISFQKSGPLEDGGSPSPIDLEIDGNEHSKTFENGKFKQQNQFHRVTIANRTSAGLLTHPYLMSGLAHFHESSPIHRGVFVSRNFLGRTLKQPNENFQPLSEDFNPSLSNRERVEFQTKDAVCMGCHVIINPVGFSLENFDAAGRYRTMEKDKPVDATAIYRTTAGESIELQGAESLASFLIQDQQAHKSFVKQIYQLYVRQPIPISGADEIDQLSRLYNHFYHSNLNIRGLLVQIAKISVEDLIEKEN